MQRARIWNVVWVVGAMFATSAWAQDVATRMDQIVRSYVDAKQFMGTVLVARDDQVVFSKAYGSANMEWNIPNDPKTKFRLGSLTKQFTAASILLLEERGKLKVEDLVKKHLANTPATWDAITIHQLLTHTSGIVNFTSLPEYGKLERFPTTIEKTLASFRDKPLDFKPGEKMSYSNSGYLLLGAIIEKVSGVSYEQFVQENIFTPLGMKDSGYDSNATIIANRASGYSSGPKGLVNAEFVHMTIPHAAGALYSTTEDLLRWSRGVYGGKLLSAASLQKMTTPFKEDYGFGVTINIADGRKAFAHGGGIQGFNTHLAYYPDTKMTVVALSNLNGQAPAGIVTKLSSVAHGGTVQLANERKEITLPADVLKAYVGTYSMAPKVNMMITLEGTQLYGQMSGQRKLPVYAESSTQFFLKAVDAQLEFGRNEKDAVTHLVLHQGGRDRKAERTSDTVLERREVAVSPEVLGRFIGAYELRPGMMLAITLESNQLMAQVAGQGKFRLYAESELSYFSKDVDVQIGFERAPTGDTTHLTLHQGPAEIRAAKQ